MCYVYLSIKEIHKVGKFKLCQTFLIVLRSNWEFWCGFNQVESNSELIILSHFIIVHLKRTIKAVSIESKTGQIKPDHVRAFYNWETPTEHILGGTKVMQESCKLLYLS